MGIKGEEIKDYEKLREEVKKSCELPRELTEKLKAINIEFNQ